MLKARALMAVSFCDIFLVESACFPRIGNTASTITAVSTDKIKLYGDTMINYLG